METTINVNGVTVSLKSEYLGNKLWPNSDSRHENYNNHKITVKANGKRATFEFWASIMHPEIDSESDLISSFECFVSDAVSGLYSFEDFCSEFGYDTDSRKAEKIHRACQKSADKLKRLLGDADIYDFANAINDIVNA